MNSSLSHHKPPHHHYDTAKIQLATHNQKQLSFANPKQDKLPYAFNNPHIFYSKSPIKREFHSIIRADSAKHLQNQRRNSNLGENAHCQNYQTEKTIQVANRMKPETLYETSSTMKEIENQILIRKSSFYPSKLSKKSTRCSIIEERRIDGDSFDVIKPIGKGKYGKVFLVRQKQTGFVLALKAIQKRKIIESNLLEQFTRELKIQFFLNHPGIIKLYGFFDDRENFYLLMELGCDGQLYDKVSDKRMLTEESSSFIARSMLEVVEYMHSQKVLHRDIKPENIVIVLGNLKICDFGWAVYNNTQMRTTFCGTPLYFSPELLSKQEYDEKVDLWSIGIMTYELVVGKSPFNLKQPQDLARIITHEVEFPKNVNLSLQFKLFIGQILEKNPQRRPSSRQLLEASFIKHYQGMQICQELCKLGRQVGAKMKGNAGESGDARVLFDVLNELYAGSGLGTIIIQMPKVIDNYILEDKIGAGQFGDVYKGYHQETKQEVAIKAIRRETIKGKFYELLENQIKVLKTCDNPNIIQLYAIKKTANHFYLMLEYCNQGDMLAYVRNLGPVPEQKAIKFLSQILNAFQALVKHKIMHRDFKLANILLHDGNIKIADFGFAKLLSAEDYATTMLGSPLNMAPEVLGGNKYNSKADIWSIGACLWQMLYGKPPYVAGNMVDLLNLIKTRPLTFPASPKVNQTLKDVLRRMLVADPKRRISWNDLFNHPINMYLANQLRKEINLELVEDQSLVMNTSKFYLKKNLVIDNPDDIRQHQKMNDYLLNVIKEGKKKQQFIGNECSKDDDQGRKAGSETGREAMAEKKGPEKRSEKKEETGNGSDMRKSILQVAFKNNIKIIMHYRNIYVFLANVADQILTPHCLTEIDVLYKDNQLVAYFLVHKILRSIKWLLSAAKSDNCLLDCIQYWQQFTGSPELAEITDYIAKQMEVFSIFKESIEPNVKKALLDGQYGGQAKNIAAGKFQESDYEKSLKKYITALTKQVIQKMLGLKKVEMFKPALRHIEFCLIAVDTGRVFGKKQFDFNAFYESFKLRTGEESLLRIERMVKQL